MGNTKSLQKDYSHKQRNAWKKLKEDGKIDSKKLFQEGFRIDIKNDWKWGDSQILRYKPKGKKLSRSDLITYPLSNLQLSANNNGEYINCEGIFVHYAGIFSPNSRTSTWYFWIFNNSLQDLICNCTQLELQNKYKKCCSSHMHRIAPIHKYSYTTINYSSYKTPQSFIYSMFKCLYYTKEFKSYFISNNCSKNLNKNQNKINNTLASGIMELMDDKLTINEIYNLMQLAPGDRYLNQNPFKCLQSILNLLHLSLNQSNSSNMILNDKCSSFTEFKSLNKSRLIDLFYGSFSENIECLECHNMTHCNSQFNGLNIPIPGKHIISLIIDVFHRNRISMLTTNKSFTDVSKPIRHVFHMKHGHTLRHLAREIGRIYNTRTECIIFCRTYKMHLIEILSQDTILGNQSIDAIPCYIVKDWLTELPANIVNKYAMYNIRICQRKSVQSRGSGYYRYYRDECIEMPFLIQIYQYQTRCDLHKIVYQRLSLWLQETKGWKLCPLRTNDHVMINTILIYGYIRQTYSSYIPHELINVIISFYPQTIPIWINSGDPDINIINQRDYFYDEWMKLLNDKPYELYWNKAGRMDISVPCDDQLFITNPHACNDIELAIKWNASSYDIIKSIVNRVVVDPEYKKWKYEMISAGKLNTLLRNEEDIDPVSLYQCFDKYTQLNNDNPEYCEYCNRIQIVNRKINISFLPKILIIYLNRFRVSRKQRIKKLVNFPVYGLELSKYLCEKDGKFNAKYNLYAIINYNPITSKSINDNGFTSYILNQQSNTWWYIDNFGRSNIIQTDILTPNACILFYQRSF